MAVCNLCNGHPAEAIWHDCGGCDKNDFCEDCGEHVSKCECERCEECDELVEDCECNKMFVVEGDLIELAKSGEFDIIVHGCNCFCTMGKGIAPQIKKAFPEAYEADCMTTKGDKTKLGQYTSAYIEEYDLVVINAYTQYDYRKTYDGTDINVDYDAMKNVFRNIARDFDTCNRIAYPLIGCGLAGGDWDIVSEIIDEELSEFEHTLVKYNKD